VIARRSSESWFIGYRPKEARGSAFSPHPAGRKMVVIEFSLRDPTKDI
jgi:hypothetical protein